MLRKRFLLTLTFIFLFSTRLILAQEPDYDRINNIASQMNCPTCVGVNLADCRTTTCGQWRDQIGDLVKEGYDDQEVLDYFETRYGTRVLLNPPKEGSTLLLWVLPTIAILAGGSWLFFILRRWKQPNPALVPVTEPATQAAPTSDEYYLKLVEKDLER